MFGGLNFGWMVSGRSAVFSGAISQLKRCLNQPRHTIIQRTCPDWTEDLESQITSPMDATFSPLAITSIGTILIITMPRLMRLLKLPAVLGFILIGVILGPAVLGWGERRGDAGHLYLCGGTDPNRTFRFRTTRGQAPTLSKALFTLAPSIIGYVNFLPGRFCYYQGLPSGHPCFHQLSKIQPAMLQTLTVQLCSGRDPAAADYEGAARGQVKIPGQAPGPFKSMVGQVRYDALNSGTGEASA